MGIKVAGFKRELRDRLLRQTRGTRLTATYLSSQNGEMLIHRMSSAHILNAFKKLYISVSTLAYKETKSYEGFRYAHSSDGFSQIVESDPVLTNLNREIEYRRFQGETL